MIEVELLLTDEFTKFSQTIAAIHAEKTAKTKEFKTVYAKYQQECAELDTKAKDAQKDWEEWKTNQMESKKTKEHK
jgi:hypothetical protein